MKVALEIETELEIALALCLLERGYCPVGSNSLLDIGLALPRSAQARNASRFAVTVAL